MSAAAVKQCNLDCAILFMQQEHADTLKGLHSEIEKLQKRCSELNFQLAMHNTSISQEDTYRERVSSLETELQKQHKNNRSLTSQLELKDKKLAQVELQIRALECHHQDELKVERQKVLSLHRDLENKATMVATLTTQLHSVKREMRLQPSVSKSKHIIKSASSVSSEDDLNLSCDSSPRFSTPTPPKDAPPKMRRRSTNRTLSTDNTECLGPVKVRPTSSQRLRADTLQTGVLDPTPFLKSVSSFSSESHEAVRNSGKTVLPPISNTKPDPSGHAQYKRRTNSDQFVKKLHQMQEIKPSSTEVEVEVLAVEQVATKNTSICRAQEYQSSD